MGLKPPPPPQYLARRAYRQRRLRDAVRVLPIIGSIFLILPVVYILPPTSAVGLYIFGVWLLLIVCAALLAATMRADAADEGAGADPTNEGTRS